MADAAPRFSPCGDAALSVEFGDAVDPALSAQVLALDAAVAEAAAAGAIGGIVETAPSFRALFVRFDPLATDHAALIAALRPLAAAARPEARAPGRSWRLPVCYEGGCAPDLAETAAAAGLSTSALVDLHVDRSHVVYMLGFLPGCPYLGDLPAPLRLPRLADPRLRAPAGSVGVAVGLTVIYPAESPGGWRLIGRSPAPLFDPSAEPPALLAPGDRVRFEPIDGRRFERLRAAADAGEWRPEPEAAPRGGVLGAADRAARTTGGP